MPTQFQSSVVATGQLIKRPFVVIEIASCPIEQRNFVSTPRIRSRITPVKGEICKNLVTSLLHVRAYYMN